MPRWCDLSKTERAWVIGAIRAGVSGDLLLQTGRWYRIKRSRSLVRDLPAFERSAR